MRHVVQSGVQVQCVELLDEVQIKCTNEYAKSQTAMRQWPVQPALFFKFSGNDKQLANDIERTAALVKQSGGADMVFAKTEREKEDLWYARKVALWSVCLVFKAMTLIFQSIPCRSALDYQPGSKCIVTDVCVPISKLPEMVERLKQNLDEMKLLGMCASALH